MLKKATIVHLRIPFSFFLMPFFLFGISQLHDIHWANMLLAFVIVHFFHNGASNAFNSYFDKDEGSIGGIENPPPVDRELYWTSLLFDVLALALALLVNVPFAGMVLIIGLASKAYSHPAVRFKKHAVGGLLWVAFFQGFWTYGMALVAELGWSADVLTTRHIWAGSICSLMLLGSYPMTQVYQHLEDSKRGDQTFSLLLGVKGTFLWTMGVFAVATALFIAYFVHYEVYWAPFAFVALTSPVVIYFLQWMRKVWKNEDAADYRSTMRLNLYSSICFNTFFILLIVC